MFKADDKYVIVNYHYVQDPSEELSGIHPCSLAEFEKQVKYLAENYQIVSIGELYEASQNGLPAEASAKAGRFCALTFDDGLRDHYENVLPVLEKYNAVGTFFPSPATFDGNLPATHKIHILLSKFTISEAIVMFHKFLDKHHPDKKDKYFIPTDKKLFARRAHEDIPTANFKETMILLPTKTKEEFLNYYFTELDLDEKAISCQFFMNKDELRDMHSRGMVIGSHSYGHYSMSAITEDLIRQDIKMASKVLFDVLGEKVDIFSYPHGHNNKASVNVLKEEGFRYAVTIEVRGLRKGDDPYLLPRYDTIHLRDYLSQN